MFSGSLVSKKKGLQEVFFYFFFAHRLSSNAFNLPHGSPMGKTKLNESDFQKMIFSKD